VRVRANSAGPRARLLLLHGGGPGVDAAQNWATVLPQLRAAFECVCPDLLGFGSALDPGNSDLHGPAAWAEARAAQVLDLLDGLGGPPVDVIGNSAGGGATALRALAARPGRFRRAVLMGGAGTGGSPSSVPFYDSPGRESMCATLANLVADPAAQSALLERMVEPRLASALRPGAESAFRRMLEPDPRPAPVDLPAITCPILLLHGARDRVAPVAISQRLAAALPNARLAVIEGAGHWIHVDQPAAFCAAIEAFLKEDIHAG
jgi:2-hydroxymuconate-semialdehyde hydrolase